MDMNLFPTKSGGLMELSLDCTSETMVPVGIYAYLGP